MNPFLTNKAEYCDFRESVKPTRNYCDQDLSRCVPDIAAEMTNLGVKKPS